MVSDRYRIDCRVFIQSVLCECFQISAFIPFPVCSNHCINAFICKLIVILARSNCKVCSKIKLLFALFGFKCVISGFHNSGIPGHDAIISDVFRSVSHSEIPVFSYLYSEDGVIKLLQNVSHCLPIDTALYSRIPDFPLNF